MSKCNIFEAQFIKKLRGNETGLKKYVSCKQKRVQGWVDVMKNLDNIYILTYIHTISIYFRHYYFLWSTQYFMLWHTEFQIEIKISHTTFLVQEYWSTIYQKFRKTSIGPSSKEVKQKRLLQSFLRYTQT